MRYSIFETGWGWVGLAGYDGYVSLLVLPLPSPEAVVTQIIKKAGPDLVRDQGLFVSVMEKVKAYFAGTVVEDWGVQVDFSLYSEFTRRVLQSVACIPYGETRTYSDVARAVGQPGAARAVGQALKRNLCPLVIPCHRVMACRGPGGFTAPGGIDLKKRLLELERHAKEHYYP